MPLPLSDLFQALLLLLFVILSGIAGWWATRKMRQKMERRLGRKLRGDHELTSISSWMESVSKDKK
jgi:NADH:ubiquinone oxidoreductase subunit H